MSDLPPPNADRPSPLLRAKEIFLQARELQGQARGALIDRLCQGEPEIKRLVEQLLEGEQSPLPFESLADEVIAAQDAMAQRSEGMLAEEKPGTRIGAYRVVEKIGEGGFGVVYLAEQEEPLRRRVALKILKLGMDTRQIVARFEAERQTLAIMDHPGIAKVFDAGATPSGRPYFVMELVDGEPITSYCDRRALPIRKRLSLFQAVCEAVQHAHQKGVIHRDLKPGNVLVCESDGGPTPKVIDFGIAKAIDQPLSANTLITEQGRFIGTPEYISPEQAAGSRDLDTRTDVYSLGVILYELLVGVTPFSRQELSSAAFAEIQRIIREVDPPKPSTRLSKADATVTAVASRRQTEPERLGRSVRGDLDWIVMRALEKERDRRYGSPTDLAQDIERHLKAEPVHAAPPSVAYRTRKFVRRHKLGVVAGSLLGVSLVAGVVGTSLGLAWALRERESAQSAAAAEAEQRALAQANEISAHEEAANAERERAAAQSERDKAQQVATFMSDLFEGVGPSFARGRDTTMLRELMDQAASRIERGDLKATPIAELAVRQNIGTICTEIGAFDAARRMLEPSVSIARTLHTQDHEAIAESLYNFATLCQATGDLEPAERLFKEAVDMRSRLYPGDHRLTANAIIAHGYVQFLRGNVFDGELALFRGLTMHRKAKPQDHAGLVRAFNALSTVVRHRGDFTQAQLTAQSALGATRAHFSADHPLAVQSLINLSAANKALGDDAAAERALFQAKQMDQRLRETPPATVPAATDVPATPPETRGDPAYAERILRQNLENARKANNGNHPVVANGLQNLAMFLRERGSAEEAERLLTECLDMRRALYPNGHNETISALRGLAAMQLTRGDTEGAEKTYREMLAIQTRLRPGPNADTSATMFLLGDLLESKGNSEAATEWFNKCLQMSKQIWVISPQLGRVSYRLGVLSQRRGDGAAAEPLLRQAAEKYAAALAPNHTETLTATVALGRALTGLKKFPEAEESLLRVDRMLKDKPAPATGHDDVAILRRQCRVTLVELYTAWDAAEPGKGIADKAKPWRD